MAMFADANNNVGSGKLSVPRADRRLSAPANARLTSIVPATLAGGLALQLRRPRERLDKEHHE